MYLFKKDRKNIKKKFGYFSLGILSFLVFGFSISTPIVFAQSEKSDLCSHPSSEFQEYLNFSHDMISVLKSIQVQKDWSYQFPTGEGIFASKLLKYPTTGINYLMRKFPLDTQGIKRTINASLHAGLSTVFNFREGGATDTRGGFVVLFKKAPFVKNMRSLQKIDGELQTLVFELGMMGKWDSTIDAKVLKVLREITNKYSGKDNFFEKFILQDHLKYNNLVRRLISLTSYMKFFVIEQYPFSNSFTKYLDKKDGILNRPHQGIIIIPNNITITTMTEKYQNLRSGGSCSSSIQALINAIKKTKKVGNDVQNSKKIIKSSVEKLRLTLLGVQQQVKRKRTSNLKDILTPHQLMILQDVYKINTNKLTKGQGLGLADLFKSSRNIKIKSEGNGRTMLNTLGKDLNNFSQWITPITNHFADQKKYTQAIKIQEYLKNKDIGFSNRISTLKSYFTATTNRVLMEQGQANLLSTTSDITPVTRKFTTIGEIIHSIQETVGNKKGQQSINTILTDICKKQCKNKGGVCRGKL